MNLEELVSKSIENNIRRKGCCGVYGIYCTSNNKLYIGASKSILRRLIGHRRVLEKNRHVNGRLQASWNKYGAESFKFFVIEPTSLEELFSRERFYIEVIESVKLFNLCPPVKAGEENVYTEYSEEWKDKIRKTLTGRKLSLTHRNNMSAASRTFVADCMIVILESDIIIKIYEDRKEVKYLRKTKKLRGFSCNEFLSITIEDNKSHSINVCFKSSIKKIILAGTVYRMRNGKFVDLDMSI